MIEPLDRLERSSPGYGPGASPSTLERQRAAALPPESRRLADVRRAACQRALLGIAREVVALVPLRQLTGSAGRSASERWPLAGHDLLEPHHEVAPQLQGSESNRRAPAYEAGLGTSTRPARIRLSTRRESNPPRRLGRPVPMPIGHACSGVEGGNRTRASPGCSRWPFHLGDLDERERADPGIGSPPLTRTGRTRRRRRESNSRSAFARRRSGPVCRTDRHLVSTSNMLRRAEESNP